MKDVIESAVAFVSAKDGAQLQLEHAQTEHQAELACLGIDEETAKKRKETEDYINKEDSLFGAPEEHDVGIHEDGAHSRGCGTRAATLKKILKEMCETDVLTRTHKVVPGCKPKDIFAETEHYPKIYTFINRISEIFAMTIEEFLTLDDIAAQPQYRKWRYSRQAAKEHLGMVREETEERKRQAAANSMKAMAEILKQGGDGTPGEESKGGNIK